MLLGEKRKVSYFIFAPAVLYLRSANVVLAETVCRVVDMGAEKTIC